MNTNDSNGNLSLREKVLTENKLKKKINFDTEELYMLKDLMTLDKYSNSSSLKERVDKLESQLQNEIITYKKLKNEINEIEKRIA